MYRYRTGRCASEQAQQDLLIRTTYGTVLYGYTVPYGVYARTVLDLVEHELDKLPKTLGKFTGNRTSLESQ